MMSILDHTPKFSLDDISHLVEDLYGLSTTAKPLPSERDQNFLLEDRSGERFVFKIANAKEDRAMLDAQNRTMMHLARHVAICPRLVSTQAGDDIAQFSSRTGTQHFGRLVTYLPGIPLGEVMRHSQELMYDLGRNIGQVDAALQHFDHPAIHRDFHWDLARGLQIIHQYKHLIADKYLQKVVNKFADSFERNFSPFLPSLRKSIVHNDTNNFNVLVGTGDDLYTRYQKVVGLIDFGDMVYSYTISDLAVAIAYAILDKPDPLITAADIVRGYHEVYPLKSEEISTLFGLVCLRLCMSVCIGTEQQQRKPDNDYLAISQSAIRNTFPKLSQIHPRLAEAVFREACGLPPVPSSESVIRWLQKNAYDFAPILDTDLRTSPMVVFDLSVSSPLISGNPLHNSELELTRRLFDLMEKANVNVGVGRHNEARLLYLTPSFATGSDPTDEYRTIHLGLDLFTRAGTPVYSPLAGKVYAFANNTAAQDYGPVVILEHFTEDNIVFYTLYGHLSKETLDKMYVGRPFAKRECIGVIGAPDENGGWTPHLHFQIITDLLDLICDFPGVARPSQRAVWCSFSPDPNLILGIPARYFPPHDPNIGETLVARRAHIGKYLSIAYREPVKLVRGWMQYMYNDEGRIFLDAYNNVPHVGHCHPRVVEAGRQQMGVLNTNTRYLHDYINRYAEKLCSMLPDPLSVCIFVNSGSEANELALRLARVYTKQRDVIVLEAAYHGNTTTLIDISPYKHNGPGGTGAPEWVHSVPIPDVYRGTYKREDAGAGEKYAYHVLEIIEQLHRRGTGLAGFIAESLPSVGGEIVLPDNYLSEVYQYVRAAGGVCIADEVQTGFGRIGSHFWGFEAQGVVPDIVVLGKPIGNGHPIGAVITIPEIAAAFDNGMEFFSTFGGNTVSCAIGLAVLDVVIEEGLQAHAFRVGNRMLAGLRPMLERYPIVGDVRGSGLFLGVELVRDRETLEPATEEASFISNRMREHGILLSTDGPYHNVIKIRPPMPFNEANADSLVTTLEKIILEDFAT